MYIYNFSDLSVKSCYVCSFGVNKPAERVLVVYDWGGIYMENLYRSLLLLFFFEFMTYSGRISLMLLLVNFVSHIELNIAEFDFLYHLDVTLLLYNEYYFHII